MAFVKPVVDETHGGHPVIALGGKGMDLSSLQEGPISKGIANMDHSAHFCCGRQR